MGLCAFEDDSLSHCGRRRTGACGGVFVPRCRWCLADTPSQGLYRPHGWPAAHNTAPEEREERIRQTNPRRLHGFLCSFQVCFLLICQWYSVGYGCRGWRYYTNESIFPWSKGWLQVPTIRSLYFHCGFLPSWKFFPAYLSGANPPPKKKKQTLNFTGMYYLIDCIWLHPVKRFSATIVVFLC